MGNGLMKEYSDVIMYTFIFFSVMLLIRELKKNYQYQKRLGSVLFKVEKRTDKFLLFLNSIMIVITIVLFYESYNIYRMFNSFVEHGTIYEGYVSGFKVQMSYYMIIIVTFIVSLIAIIRGDEIREKGISTTTNTFFWNQVVNYKQVDDTTIVIQTSKKNLFNVPKKIKWDVSENDFESLIQNVNKHIENHN